MENVIVFEDLIAEASAAAAMDLAASALNGTIHRVIQESGGISKDEVTTISNLYTKIINEAMDEFVPSEEELEEIKKQLEAAGYKIVKAEEVEAEKAPEAEAEAGETGETRETGEADEAEEKIVQESADLAAKIAAKLEIL